MNVRPDVAAVINICRREKGREEEREGGRNEQEKKGKGRERKESVLPSFPGNAGDHCNQLVLSFIDQHF